MEAMRRYRCTNLPRMPKMPMAMAGEDDPIARRIGGNIKRYRNALGLSQPQAARRTPEMTPDQFSKYERGEQRPRPPAMRDLATALTVTPEDLLDPPDLAAARAQALEAARDSVKPRRKKPGSRQ